MTKKRIGRYEVVKELGAGAMAVVYKAVDPVIGRTVAIKTIKIDSSIGIEHKELRQRFYREAQSAGNLSHPNIVTIYDIGEEGNVDYIAMEFVEGKSLQDWIAENPIPPAEQTVSIIEQVASGLDYAAANGIIHRDIKPANILLTQEMKVKIADFGIAKLSTSQFTQTGALMGTPSYMSPEQAMGKTLDGRSDIFSLGVIFYEMLTGEKPFSGTNPATIIYKILHEDPVQPRKLNVTLHPAFDEIIRKMLAKDPEKRYQSCSQLIKDLKDYSSPKTGEAEPALTAAAAEAEVKSKSRYRFIAIASVLAVILAISGFLYYRQSRQPAPPDAAATMTIPPAPAITESDLKVPPPSASEEKPVSPEIPVEEAEKQTPLGKEPPSAAAETPSAASQEEAAATEAERAPAEKKPAPVVKKPTFGEIRLEYAGESYPISVYDGSKRLRELSASNPSMQLATGVHRFRIVSGEVFLDYTLDQIRLNTDQVFSIPVPALCSAFIDVPNDAYDGCEIQLGDRKLEAPYPAQIPRLAAGSHRIAFRWNSGKYGGTKLVSTFETQANHHYRIRGEPDGEEVIVQQIR
jgi:serine/threonine protein kinase